jgi:hypothetical protein
MKYPTPLAILLIALAVPAVVPVTTWAASSCSVMPGSRSVPTTIRADGKDWDVPRAGLPDVPCSGLSVLRGQAILIFETSAGDTKSLMCGPGECAAPTGAKSFWKSLMARLEGAPERRPGGKRYDEDARRLEGLPSGKIYSLERAGLFDFRALGAGGWTLVVTREPGRAAIVQRAGSDPVVQLPASLFQRGGKYGWVLTAGGKRFTGGFDVLAPGPAAEVERDLREAGVTSGPRTRKQQVDELIVLFEHDLDHEVRLLYRELGL